MAQDYSNYVDHPRWGRSPRISGDNPDSQRAGVHLHWINGPLVRSPQAPDPSLRGHYWVEDGSRTVENTAIRADLTKQSAATVPVTHYFDLDKQCLDCGRRFLFFAEEQRYWYEELGLPLEANCVRCLPCRKEARQWKQLRHRYQELVSRDCLSSAETLEVIEAYLSLVEQGEFSSKRIDRVRMYLRRLPEVIRESLRCEQAVHRLHQIEDRSRTPGPLM